MARTLTLKVDENTFEKLQAIAPSLRLKSPSLVAKQILITAVTSGAGDSGGFSQEALYSIQADIQHLSLETQNLTAAVEHLATFMGAVTELILINACSISAEEASKTVKELLNISFGE